MPDFLLELRSEEIPARMQDRAREDLRALFERELATAGLRAAEVRTYATPRRLALIAWRLPAATEAMREERKGPRADAPPQAIEGFLRSTGLTREQLEERPDKKGAVLFAAIERPGRPTSEVLAEAIPAIVRAFPWPKSMRWGAASISADSPRWVRPLQGIVALLSGEGSNDGQLIEVEIAGVRASAATVGHRFHHPGLITMGSAQDYQGKLRACHVIVDGDERRRIIAEGARTAAADAGLHLVEDDGLVAENAGLTEWPIPLLGSFDPAFLQVPREIIQLTMRTNQKYFSCLDAAGDLAPAFVLTANIAATDGGTAIAAGNARVLAARLADARFFWENDLKTPLESQAEKLDGIVFHEKLGTVADKVDRVARLARWLVEDGIIKPFPLQGRGLGEGASSVDARSPRSGDGASDATAGGSLPLSPTLSFEGQRERLAALAERAARLCKADLVTGLVGEFPELQGVMGGHLARAQGEAAEVADAIRDHYRPVGQGDEVPTAPVTVAVSLADKLDTIAVFFYEGMPPTGSRDPFALRRAALAVIALLEAGGLRLPLTRAVTLAISRLGRLLGKAAAQQVQALLGAREAAGLPLTDEVLVEAKGAALDRHLSEEARQKLIVERVRPTVAAVLEFFADRLKVQQREAGVRHDLIDAVFALGGEDDLVRLLARVRALQRFVEGEDGANLLTGYKRAANILKKEEWDGSPENTLHPGLEPGPTSSSTADEVGRQAVGRARDDEEGRGQGEKSLSYSPEPAEYSLRAALDSAEPRVGQALAAEEFERALAVLAELRAPVDRFFDEVTVNDPNPAKRATRLSLLARLRDAAHRVADFSRIEG